MTRMTMTGRHAAASIMTVIPVTMTSGQKPLVKSQNQVNFAVLANKIL
jgi:hypothetical protein